MRVMALALFGSLVLPATLVAASLTGTAQESAPPAQAPRFVLAPTTGVSPSESGVVEFGGPASAVTDISLKLQQLAPGLYWIVMVRKSDGAEVTLAPLSVLDTSEIEPDRRAGADPNQRTSSYQVQVLQTQAQIKIPAPFDATDIAQLLVEDINGSVVLAGTPERP